MEIKKIPYGAIADYKTIPGRFYQRFVMPNKGRSYIARLDKETGAWMIRYKFGKKWHQAELVN